MKKFTLLLLVVCTLSCSKKSDDSDEYQPTSGILKYLVESDLDSFQVTYKGINGETITTTV